ncbi:MAG TPA: hypothetical protein VMG10_29335 [Gemmataceae bacterium]|nr:hypothetical protein [Gemmataceae bacterium]
MACDAIARQYDVDADSTKLTRPKDQKGGYQLGTIEFAAKKGKSIDLDKIHESITATRLSGGTGMRMDYLEITAKGEVIERDKKLIFKVSGTGQELVLSEEPTAKGGLQRLRDAVARGDRVSTITGRVPGWNGVFPAVLAAWAKLPDAQKRKLTVVDFKVEKK